MQGSGFELLLIRQCTLLRAGFFGFCRYIDRSEIVICQRSDGRLWELGAGSTAKVCHQHCGC